MRDEIHLLTSFTYFTRYQRTYRRYVRSLTHRFRLSTFLALLASLTGKRDGFNNPTWTRTPA